jgi:SAM-dependent methyltransferase
MKLRVSTEIQRKLGNTMSSIIHYSAKASHYNKEVSLYDVFNEKNSFLINQVIDKILDNYRVKSVLDLTCGTGSQVFWLAKHGYKVAGSDINSKMLKIAKEKAQKEKLDVQFIKGDMRITQAGKFDAFITIFNAVGHLTKNDFEKTMLNINTNLNDRGLYVFDIFNLSYLLADDNITKLTIDRLNKSGDTTAREIQYSTINNDGVLVSYEIYHEQIGSNKPKISKAFQTLQVYSAKQLKEMLQKNGFKVLRQCGIDGSRFYETKTDRLLTIARKSN